MDYMKSLKNFAKLGISADMLKTLQEKGFEEPTPVQKKIIPLILDADQDLIGQAKTGTGKTAAFGIPIIERISESCGHTQALVLTPTRELAIQVAEEINSFKGKKKLHILPVYGGQSIEQQLKRLKKGVDIVVGTPGRIQDHIKRKTLNFSKISYLVLDEADEMLNMGFLEEVKNIISTTNTGRTTLLFSATMPREIAAIAKNYMRDHIKIKIEPEENTAPLTDHIYFEVNAGDKFEALCRIIDFEDKFYGLVFCRTKVDVNNIASHLKDRGYDAEGLHGDISQSQRLTILDSFKKKRINILVATDVAARGIDIQNLSHVINYAIPQDSDSYVHRIGRTGRAGKEGTAITFITPEEYRKLMYIKNTARTEIRKEKLPDIQQIIAAKRTRIMDELDSIIRSETDDSFLKMAMDLIEKHKPEKTLAALLKYTFHDKLDPAGYNEIRDVYPQISGKTRLFVAKGKKDKMSKRALVDFIIKKTNVDGRKIDDVQVLDSYSFITVPFKEAERILASFKKANKGKRSMVEVSQKTKSSRR